MRIWTNSLLFWGRGAYCGWLCPFGSVQDWLLETTGLRYDQRNAVVIGIAMGFAVIPLIYTISEDALTAVPDHLRAASLGAGATQWQTMILVIVPPAMSGLFSAAMIGLGRAVGETMIVLMAGTVFWLDPSIIPTRMSVVVTTMLTLIAYRFMLANHVPRLPYLTRLDWFMLGATVLVICTLFTMAGTSYLVSRGMESIVGKIDRAFVGRLPIGLDSLAEFVDPKCVDENFDARLVQIIATAKQIVHAQDRLDVGEEVLFG